MRVYNRKPSRNKLPEESEEESWFKKTVEEVQRAGQPAWLMDAVIKINADHECKRQCP